MFSSNEVDEIVKTNFKIFGRKKKCQPDTATELPQANPEPELEPLSPSTIEISALNNLGTQNNNELPIEQTLVSIPPQASVRSTRRSSSSEFKSQSEQTLSQITDQTDESILLLEDEVDPTNKNWNGVGNSRKNSTTKVLLDSEKTNVGGLRAPDEDLVKGNEVVKQKIIEEDRRKNAWLQCTCPQYKVSKELATKWDSQGVFFGKILVVKVLQLLVINLVVFVAVIESDKTWTFLKKVHDWAYFSYGLFVCMLVCIRWGVGYRSKWPLAASIILMIPLTIPIAFTCACVTVVHNTFLIPLVTSSIFLTFLILAFTPYLLRKSVMHRTTNLAGCGISFLTSFGLIFLKEFGFKPISYWDFLAQVWLPALILSQIVVQVTIFEIQRIIFGLCFNVSTKRWHIAALYI